MLNRRKKGQFFNSWPCFFPVNFLLFFRNISIPYGAIKSNFFASFRNSLFPFQFLMVRLFMIQRYITFLEIPNFLHTIFYTFLLIFINFVYKQLIVNMLVCYFFCFLYLCIYCIFKFLFYIRLFILLFL